MRRTGAGPAAEHIYDEHVDRRREFGGGRADRVHARLFADLMTDLDPDTAYGRYLDATGPEALATVNLMSLFGLHRALRGALVGHFATAEITSSPGSRRRAQAICLCRTTIDSPRS